MDPPKLTERRNEAGSRHRDREPRTGQRPLLTNQAGRGLLDASDRGIGEGGDQMHANDASVVVARHVAQVDDRAQVLARPLGEVTRPSWGSVQSPLRTSTSLSLTHRDAAVFVGRVWALITPLGSR